MKKFILLLGFLLIPTLVSASSYYGNEQDLSFFVSNNNYYSIWWIVNISQDISKDLYLIWWMLNIKWAVWQDLWAIWWMVNVSSNIWDDVRIIGWNVVIEWNIKWDLMINWWQILVKKNVKIDWNLIINWWNILFEWDVLWDAYINWWDLNLNWSIWWNVEFRVDQINIWNKAIIKWNIIYYSKLQNNALERITLWTKKFKTLEKKWLWKKVETEKSIKKEVLWFIWIYLIYRFLFLLIFWIIIYFAFEKLLKETAIILEKNYWKSFFLWIAYYWILPFIILLLLISVIWIPFGIFWIFIYIFSFVFYKLFIVLVFSGFFINKLNLKQKKYFGKSKEISIWKKLWIITIIALLISPWALIDLLIAFFAVWAIGFKKLEIYKSLK